MQKINFDTVKYHMSDGKTHENMVWHESIIELPRHFVVIQTFYWTLFYYTDLLLTLCCNADLLFHCFLDRRIQLLCYHPNYILSYHIYLKTSMLSFKKRYHENIPTKFIAEKLKDFKIGGTTYWTQLRRNVPLESWKYLSSRSWSKTGNKLKEQDGVRPLHWSFGRETNEEAIV